MRWEHSSNRRLQGTGARGVRSRSLWRDTRRRALPQSWSAPLALALVGLVACSDGEREQRLEVLAGAPTPTPVFEDGSVTSSSNSGGTTSTGSTSSASGTTSSNTGAFPIPADPGFQPTESLACGDGVRDGATEECDDGVGAALDACTADCQVDDFLVEHWPGSSEPGAEAPAHTLGESRHPIAAGDQGFAVAYVERIEGGAPRVKLARYTQKGLELDRAIVSEGTLPSDYAHPSVAELPSGDYAVSWADFGTDGDELGIALRKVGAADLATCGRLYEKLDTVYDVNVLRQLDAGGAWLSSASWALSGGATEVGGPDGVLSGFGSSVSFTSATLPDSNAAAQLVIDLGAPWSLGELRQVYQPGLLPDSVELELSLDGSSYQSAVASQAPTGEDFRWLVYPPVEAQFLRLTMTGVPAAGAIELLALELRPSATVGQPVTSDLGLDVTSLGAVTVTGSGWDASVDPLSIVDDQVGGVSGESSADGATEDGVLTVDLGTQQRITAVDPQFAGDGAWENGGRIELSADGQSWVLLVDAALGTPLAGGPYLTAEPTLARYVRLTNFFGASGGPPTQSLGRLDEVSVFTAACPEAKVSAPLFFAPQLSDTTQLGADLVWTGSELVAAWQDFNDAQTGPNLYYRRFDAALSALGDQQPLASEPGPEGALALSKFAGDFAVAYRLGKDSGLEDIVVKVPATSGEWRVTDVAPGAAGDRPALVELDASHLLVAYTSGYAASVNSSVWNDQQLYVAVIDVATGDVSTQEVTLQDQTYAEAESKNQPTAARVGDGVFLGWRTSSRLADIQAEEIWLKRLPWSGTLLNYDLPEVSLPRWADHRFGDQRLPAMAATSLGPSGALLMAWEDWGPAFGPLEGKPDVALQLAPTPVLRGSDKREDCNATLCTAGQGPCTETTCAAGLVCRSDVGPKYNYGPDTPVCTPTSCLNGVQDPDETGIDCGESCGLCLSCPDPSELGRSGYCHPACPCAHAQGDCEPSLNHADCEEGLICAENVGDVWGYPSSEIDVCVKPHCVNGFVDEDEVRVDCGGVDCPGCGVGGDDYCSPEQLCQEGEGHCESDAECEPPLVCAGAGPDYGLGPDVTVCIPAACANLNPPLPPINSEGHCTETCRCPTGVGICDSAAQCLGYVAPPARVKPAACRRACATACPPKPRCACRSTASTASKTSPKSRSIVAAPAARVAPCVRKPSSLPASKMKPGAGASASPSATPPPPCKTRRTATAPITWRAAARPRSSRRSSAPPSGTRWVTSCG